MEKLSSNSLGPLTNKAFPLGATFYSLWGGSGAARREGRPELEGRPKIFKAG